MRPMPQRFIITSAIRWWRVIFFFPWSGFPMKFKLRHNGGRLKEKQASNGGKSGDSFSQFFT